MTSPATAALPDIRRPDAGVVFVSHWYVPGRESGTAALRELAGQWSTAAWPPGILSFSCFLSDDDDTVLTYTQCRDAAAYGDFVRSLTGPARAGAVEYRLHRSVVTAAGHREAGCVVIAAFDVDGAERQEHVIGSLVETLESMPLAQHPGMISANFHASVDGTRVLNYAEWTSDAAHDVFLDGASRASTLRASNDIPGVRPVGFKRYRLHSSVVR
ncbi:antibiotic biosynthesis monooxygenase family protein [Streptomyces griseocarneus]|uniref:antibiotic biosynthesis monooxygenase family protein n=1 Tax=Streptomyces griseocarneus TaxID=51201 RepID=UPI00167DF48C|nr:antibiotic biosynthesis monooxygenase [Streptomyces griseocarneus]MBZ6477612.1 antibiotic biosynthesis monooxygenase [Streptomyces griseocarneus]GHG83307.1 antibiotic biosynthesis monooxygenase [Streptomyces griseocarneus]